jgi:enoyl-CoA hydratase
LSVVLVEHQDAVALVTLNRPDSRNALDSELITGLSETVAALDGDDATRAIVLTGADPAFCAGLDLRALAEGGGRLVNTPGAGDRGPIGALTTPLIGAVNGAAVTGGFELALACHFLIASDRARFADTHARVGIMPGWGLTVRLPARIGVTRAREMSFTGNFVDASTALQWGLVNHVVPHERLLPTALGLAADIAGNDPAAVDRLRMIYDEGDALDADPRWSVERRTAGQMPGGFDAAAMDARRKAVIERGRQQTDSPNS